MDNLQEFRPARQRGVILHAGILLLLLAGSGTLLMLAMAQSSRGFFILYLVFSLVVFLPIPILLYRLFALLKAKYVIDREGFHIQWGLRTEDIPMQEVEWLRLASDMPYEVPLPRLSVQGAILGVIQTKDLGRLEFTASDSAQLVLIATRAKVLVISPADIETFVYSFRHFSEMGSIAPIQAASSNAEFLVTSLIKDKYVRSFIAGGIFLSIGLLTAVSFLIPMQTNIPLGFNPASGQLEPAPSERLLLLPVAALFFLAADVGVGSYLYRKQGFRTAAYLAFASALIIPLSFLLLVLLFVL